MGRQDRVYPGTYFAWVDNIPADVLTSRAHVDYQQTVYTEGEYRLDMQVRTKDGFRSFQAQVNENASRKPSVSCVLISVAYVDNDEYKYDLERVFRQALLDAGVPREGLPARDYMIRIEADGSTVKVNDEKKGEKKSKK